VLIASVNVVSWLQNILSAPFFRCSPDGYGDRRRGAV
jgi:hypothetical protein